MIVLNTKYYLGKPGFIAQRQNRDTLLVKQKLKCKPTEIPTPNVNVVNATRGGSLSLLLVHFTPSLANLPFSR